LVQQSGAFQRRAAVNHQLRWPFARGDGDLPLPKSVRNAILASKWPGIWRMSAKIKRLIGAALLAVSLSPVVAGSLTFPATDANAWTGAPPQGAVFLQLMYGKNYDLNNAHSALRFMEWQYEESNKVDFETAAHGGPLNEATRYLLSGLRRPDFSNFILNELTDDFQSSQSDINKLKFWTRVASILYWGGTPFNSPEIRSHASDVIYNIMQANANDPQKLEVLADLSRILFSKGGV
jgi:hypothetical protein